MSVQRRSSKHQTSILRCDQCQGVAVSPTHQDARSWRQELAWQGWHTLGCSEDLCPLCMLAVRGSRATSMDRMWASIRQSALSAPLSP